MNSAKHGIAIASETVTGQYGSSTVLQQVNDQSDQQCEWTDSWGAWSQNWESVTGFRGCKISLVSSLFTYTRGGRVSLEPPLPCLPS